MEGTATIAPEDTAADQVAPTDEAPEPDGLATTETEQGEETDSADPYDGKTPEEIRALVAGELERARKDERAKAGESFRQQLEAANLRAQAEANERTYTANRQRADAVLRGQVTQHLTAAVQAAFDAGKDQVDHGAVRMAAAAVHQAALHTGHEAYSNALTQLLHSGFPEYKASPHLIAQRDEAVRAYDAVGMAQANMALMYEALAQQLTPQLRAQVAAELAKADKGAAATAAARTATTAKAPAPTPGRGAGTSRSMTLAEIEAMPTSDWLAMPKEQRGRLLADAHKKGR